MIKCELCTTKKCKFNFNRKYKPDDFIEGKTNSKIWIVGLNPKADFTYTDKRDISDLNNFFMGKDKADQKKTYSYFKDFKKVSDLLYKYLGKEEGVAHTDIVKCFSNEFPPKGCSKKDIDSVISNCSTYFIKQIEKYSPKMIICNGSYVCREIQKIVSPKESISIRNATHYIGIINTLDGEKEIIIVLSGFIGRIDDYAKKRLGKEIEELICSNNILKY